MPPGPDEDARIWYLWHGCTQLNAWMRRNLECYAARGPETRAHVKERLARSCGFARRYVPPMPPRKPPETITK